MERKLQGLKILADAVTASETPLSSSMLQANSPALTPKVSVGVGFGVGFGVGLFACKCGVQASFLYLFRE